MSLICGVGCEIHKSANISKNADVILGDYVYIGPNVKISDGIVRIGDYSKIHDNVYINPKLHVVPVNPPEQLINEKFPVLPVTPPIL